MNAGFLMCQNPACCLILDLRQARHSIRHSALLAKGCPDCGQPWAARCTVCSHTLSVVRAGRFWRCRSCQHSKANKQTRGTRGPLKRGSANGHSSVFSN